MDENSSKFVDQLATGKLLNEKLAQVHHQPEDNVEELFAPLYTDFHAISPRCELIRMNDQMLQMTSPILGADPENEVNPIIAKEVPGAVGSIVFVHGLFEDSRDLYNFLFKGLNKAGYHVYLMTLPFHYERVPAASRFSGEYFWSANVHRSRRAFRQAVYELYQCYHTLHALHHHPVYLAGFSMGGGVALSLASLHPDITGIFVINPVCSLTEIVWDSPLCRTIKADLLDQHFTFEQIQRFYAVFEPASVGAIALDTQKICLAYGCYDQITSIEQYKALAATWKIHNMKEYRAGHLNMLRVPRLADDMCAFFQSLP
jgi:pimeloyl-ACP methyl ester carboxylesterase